MAHKSYKNKNELKKVEYDTSSSDEDIKSGKRMIVNHVATDEPAKKKYKKKKNNDYNMENISEQDEAISNHSVSEPVKKKEKKKKKNSLDECHSIKNTSEQDEVISNHSASEPVKKKEKKKKKISLDERHSLENTSEQDEVISNHSVSEPVKKKQKKKNKNSLDECHSIENNSEQDEVISNHLTSEPMKKSQKKNKNSLDECDSVKNNSEQDESILNNLVTESMEKKKKKEKNNHERIIENNFEEAEDDSKHSITVKPVKKKRKNKKGNDTESSANIIPAQDNSLSDLTEKSLHDESYDKDNFLFTEFTECILPSSEIRNYTLSIAVPASILKNTCRSNQLRTYITGQIARAACIYSVDEIIVYDDFCWGDDDYQSYNEDHIEYIAMMKMILEYQECPQYLRKSLFSHHHYVANVGLLNALNAPHHLLSDQWCSYREGVVTERGGTKSISYVDVGLHHDIVINKKLKPGLRVTVHFPPETTGMKKPYGIVVSPEEPRKSGGFYWGYTVRTALSLSEVFQSDRFPKYDLVIGTSDKGDDVEEKKFSKFSHGLIVFGGVDGLEAAIKADKSVEVDLKTLFPHYLNVCPNQTSRTIRTEEAILISLTSLCPKFK